MSTQHALDTAVNTQEESKLARTQVAGALERATEDLQRGQELLKCTAFNDEAAQLGEAGSLKERLEANAAARKKQREKSRAAMEKSLMANDMMVVATVLNSWENLTKKPKVAEVQEGTEHGACHAWYCEQ
jgi:hypothetical protein